jgi:imidazoleglycerol-phosphate dehydratase
MRQIAVERNTKETQIQLTLNLDQRIAESTISTGLGFFDHMLEQLSRHGHFGLSVAATGDLVIDSHHLVEDVGLALGDAFSQALGDRVGIARWGEAHVPMDETLARVVVDLSGRPYCVFTAQIPSVVLGNGFQTEMVREFFFAFATRAKLNLHAAVLYGDNTHHKVEALFKGLARALRAAVKIESSELPSTKGTLHQ